MAEYMLPSGGVVSDPGDGLELMLPDGGVLNQQEAAPPGGFVPYPRPRGLEAGMYTMSGGLA